MQRLQVLAFAMIFALVAPSTTLGQEHDGLERTLQNVVEVKAWIEPNAEIIASQQVMLYIEVSTPNWFSGGTRISAFEIEDVVVLRREKFSVNSTRRMGDLTWSVQLWSISLYPQTQGTFLVPEIELVVSTAGEGRSASDEVVKTEPISFVATTPDEIAAYFHTQGDIDAAWLASNRFQISERYDKSLSNLEVGSSVKRVIEIQSENVAAMMLPAIQFASTEGLAAYQEPPIIKDRVNRGDYLATRIESVSYFVEKAGSYPLPQLDFHWWDIHTQTLRKEVLPAQIISTVGFASSASTRLDNDKQTNNLGASIGFYFKLLFVVSALFFVFVLWWMIVARPSAATTKRKELLDLERLYQENCAQGEFSQASIVFYQWLSAFTGMHGMTEVEHSVRCWLSAKNEPEVLKMFDDLMATAHSRTRNRHSDAQVLSSLIPEAKRLLLASKPLIRSHQEIELQLN